MSVDDPRKHWPAAERNREPILEVLRTVVPGQGELLEVASGTGQHTAHFAQALPGLRFQPTDVDPEALPSIDAWCAGAGLPNVAPARELDVLAESWPFDRFDVVYNANMIHISPWACALGLMRGAAAHLRPGGVLVVYGPFRIGGAHTAPSNAAFDESLRSRDPSWGVRDLEAVVEAAEARGLGLSARHGMPANNQLLVFHRD